MRSGRDVDLQRLIAEGEWLGIRMELESDRAKRQQMYEWNRNNGGRNSRR
jgi:hypothetical protein